MKCSHHGPVSLNDDDDEYGICDACLNAQLAEVERFEPADDPQPRELLPDPESLAIERDRPTAANIARLYNNFVELVEAVRDRPVPGVPPLTEIDVLCALDAIMRAYVEEMVIARAGLNPTSAVANSNAIVHVLHKLIDDTLALKIPSPVVN